VGSSLQSAAPVLIDEPQTGSQWLDSMTSASVIDIVPPGIPQNDDVLPDIGLPSRVCGSAAETVCDIPDP